MLDDCLSRHHDSKTLYVSGIFHTISRYTPGGAWHEVQRKTLEIQIHRRNSWGTAWCDGSHVSVGLEP